jgi:cell division septum initiation protein DivIVA
MNDIQNLTVGELRKILSIKEEIEELQHQLASLANDGEIPSPSTVELPKKRRMSAAGRARIAAAAKKRWAKFRSGSASPAKKKRKMSRAVRAKMAEAARQRWAEAKAAGKNRL